MSSNRMCDVLLSALIAGVLYTGCGVPAEAQNTTCSNRPAGDISNACANTRFVSQNTTNLGWYIVGSANYPTIQSAVTAAGAAGGGTVYIPCGSWPLGSGTIGLNIDALSYIRIIGSSNMSGGAGGCSSITYTGTGTIISAKAANFLEIGHIAILGSAAAKGIDFTTGSATNTSYPYIHDSTINGQVGVSILMDAASTTNLRVSRTTFINGAIGIRGITSGGGIAAGQFMVNANISDNNVFQSTLTTAAIQGLETATVAKNIFQGQIVGYASGPATTCHRLNWLGNWHGDTITPQPLIQSNCLQLVTEGNLLGAAGGAAITQANNTGSITSKGDNFTGSNPFIALGTSNFLSMSGLPIGGPAPIITGTPTVSSFPTWLAYGSVSINTSTGGLPLIVGATTGTAPSGGLGIQVVANDFATNSGVLRIGKDTGAGGAGHIASFGVTNDPIVFDNGNITLGVAGTSNGNAIFRGSTSGAITVQPQAAAGTFNFNLPTTAGASGAFLTSGGGGASPMTWSSIGTGCATWLATPSSANLASCMTDETGTAGNLVFSGSPTLTTPFFAAANGGSAVGSTMTLNGTTNGAPSAANLFLQTNGQSVRIGSSSTPQSPVHIGLGTDAPNQTSQLYVSNTGTTVFTLRDSTNDIDTFLGTNSALGGIGLFGTRTNHPLYIQTNSGNNAAFPAAGGLNVGTALVGTAGADGQVLIGANLNTTTYITVGTKIRAGASAPTITAGCSGAGSSISGSDLAGQVVGSTAAATSCQITFNAAYAATPYCVATGNSSPLTGAVTATTSTLTVNFASTANFTWSYICVGRNGG